MTPFASGIPGLDPVTEITGGGGDGITATAVHDLDLQFALACLSGTEEQVGMLGNDPRHPDHDLCRIALLENEFFRSEIDLRIGGVGDLRPRCENPLQSHCQEWTVVQCEDKHHCDKCGENQGRPSEGVEIDYFGSLQLPGFDLCVLPGQLPE